MPEQEFTDAIALLKADHRKVEDLFGQFEKAAGSTAKARIAQQICNELKIHTMIEEELFYPAFRGKIDNDLLDEAYVEHDGAKVLINDIEAGDPSNEFYDAKVKVLKEEIEHHVEEEEKPKEGLFAQTRAAEIDLKVLGERIVARKEALQQEIKEDGLPAPEATTLDEVDL